MAFFTHFTRLFCRAYLPCRPLIVISAQRCGGAVGEEEEEEEEEVEDDVAAGAAGAGSAEAGLSSG